MNKKWRIIDKGKGVLSITILNLQEVCCDIINTTAARTSLEDTKLIVAKELELQAFAERVDHQIFTTAGTGVHSSYFASVVIGGTDFAIGAVQGEISSDEGYFDRHYYGDSKVELVNKSAPYTYVYIDKDLVLQQQISTPTEQDWNRKIFVMRIVVDTNTNLILGFGYYSNPIGHYGNTIRTLWKYLLANGVPFRIGQEVTGSPTDLSFDIAAGTLMVYGSTGNINAPHEKEFDLVESTNFTLIYRTTIGATVNQLPKVWDSNGTITPLGSTTCVAHRIYRYSTGDVVLAIGQGNYANMVLCKAGALLEQYVLNPLLKDAVFMGWWLIEETATSTSGTVDAEFVEYTIGIQGGSSSGLSGALLRGNNLSDLLDTAAARTNLGAASTAQGVLADNSVQLTGGTSQTIAGNVEATSFIKTGGVGNEILLDDGSTKAINEISGTSVQDLNGIEQFLSRDIRFENVEFDIPNNKIIVSPSYITHGGGAWYTYSFPQNTFGWTKPTNLTNNAFSSSSQTDEIQILTNDGNSTTSGGDAPFPHFIAPFDMVLVSVNVTSTRDSLWDLGGDANDVFEFFVGLRLQTTLLN